MVFGQNLKNFISAKQDINGKGISRAAEWHENQLHSTFQRGVIMYMSAERNLIMCMHCSSLRNCNEIHGTIVFKECEVKIVRVSLLLL